MPGDGLAHRIGPYVHRWQPQTLRGRLVLASVLFGVVAAGVTFTLTYAATAMRYNSVSEEVAVGQLRAFRAFIEIERADVARFATAMGDVWDRRRSESPSATTPSAAWMIARMEDGRLTALVAVDREGRRLTAIGPVAQTEVLERVASSADPDGRSGLAWADGTCFVVATRPIMDTTGLVVGRLAVARPLAPSADARFLPLAEDLTLRLVPAALPRTAAARSLAGFPAVVVESAGAVSTIHARLDGIDTSAAGSAVITVHDARIARAVTAASVAALFASLVVGLLGAVLGLTLSSGIRRPIDRTRRHLREQAPNALAGRPCEPMLTRPETTEDFRELSTEIDALLDALSARQGELVATMNDARAAEAALRAVLDDSPEGKLLVESGQVRLANRAAEDILGIPADELVGMSTATLAQRMRAYGEDGERLDLDDLRAVAIRPITARVSVGGRPDRWVFVTVVPHAADTSQLLVSARDVTEDRRLDALREEVFALVSHDLRAPLTVVRGYLDILERPLQPEARERAIASARYNATKMADLLEDLLDATSAEDMLAPKELMPVDLVSVAEEVASSLQPTAKDHRIVVEAAGPIIVSGESGRLRQAIVNLVTNGVKYSPPDTTVTIRVGTCGGRACLVVDDEGPGIPSDARETVFDRYGRVAETCAGKPGFGLGLYIVRLIASNHGGHARVEDAPGGGARFVIELPLVADSAA